MEKPSVMQRKYMPVTATATAIQWRDGRVCLKKICPTGTSTIYSAVTKPALPADAPILIASC